MAKLGIVYNGRIWSKLTKFFTGSEAYHVLWLEDDLIYDMHLLRRRRPAANHYRTNKIKYYNFPFVTKDYLEMKLTTDNNSYGFIDYLMFSLRPFYHLVGKSTRNYNGIICSEMCNIDLITCGYVTPWAIGNAPPSPADFERWLLK